MNIVYKLIETTNTAQNKNSNSQNPDEISFNVLNTKYLDNLVGYIFFNEISNFSPYIHKINIMSLLLFRLLILREDFYSFFSINYYMYVTLPSPTGATHLYCFLFLFIFYNKFICGIPGVV